MQEDEYSKILYYVKPTKEYAEALNNPEIDKSEVVSHAVSSIIENLRAFQRESFFLSDPAQSLYQQIQLEILTILKNMEEAARSPKIMELSEKSSFSDHVEMEISCEADTRIMNIEFFPKDEIGQRIIQTMKEHSPIRKEQKMKTEQLLPIKQICAGDFLNSEEIFTLYRHDEETNLLNQFVVLNPYYAYFKTQYKSAFKKVEDINLNTKVLSDALNALTDANLIDKLQELLDTKLKESQDICKLIFEQYEVVFDIDERTRYLIDTNEDCFFIRKEAQLRE